MCGLSLAKGYYNKITNCFAEVSGLCYFLWIYFEDIIKKHEAVTDNPLIHINIKKWK